MESLLEAQENWIYDKRRKKPEYSKPSEDDVTVKDLKLEQ